MAFWRVAGFAQPSPIEQILDKDDYTLEDLLDEDDIIQECKSLNGRLIAFLKEREVVEQLLKYLVQPPSDPDDPKKQYKYPFTACEVFCCEVEAIFNTLLEDEALLDLLFSLLDTEPPLSCKTAGYFGRVVGQLLLRKPNEMMQYLSHHDGLLEKLVRHLDVTSIADVLKRLAGADEQSAMVYQPMHTQWLVDTQLLDQLLDLLAPDCSSDAVTNAADILTAIAHSQPSALSAKLMQPSLIMALFKRALAPGGKLLVPALDVASALLEPRRNMGLDGVGSGITGSGGGSSDASSGDASSDGSSPTAGSAAAAAAAAAAASGRPPRSQAQHAMLMYLPDLVHFLGKQDAATTQETPYGLLAPPLGRARLKVVELLAVLLHVGDEAVDSALISAGAMGLVLDLFAQYPFNNLLHHQVYYMVHGVLLRGSPAMVAHTFGEPCRLPAWLAQLPKEVTPTQLPGGPAPQGPLRAGYLGHVTRIGNMLVAAAAERPDVAKALEAAPTWAAFVDGDLRQRNEVEDVARWECGRPASTEMGDLGSDGDDFQNDMDLEQMQGMQPALYHRYGVLDDGDDDDSDSDGSPSGLSGPADLSGTSYGNSLAAAMQNMDLNDGGGAGFDGGGVLADVVQEREVEGLGAGGGQGTGGGWSLLAHPGGSQAAAPPSAAAAGGADAGMEDDAVLLSTSDDEDGACGSTRTAAAEPQPVPEASGTVAAEGGSGAGLGASPPGDDVVFVEPPAAPSDDAAAATAALAGGLADASLVTGSGSSSGSHRPGFSDHAAWVKAMPAQVAEEA